MNLEIKLKSIDIDIYYMTKINELGGNECADELNRLKELRKEILKSYNEEIAKKTELPINNKITFKKFLFNIAKDDSLIIKKTNNNIYLLSKKTNELLKYNNIDKEKFYEFLRNKDILIAKRNYLHCRAGKKVYVAIPIELEGLNRLASRDNI